MEAKQKEFLKYIGGMVLFVCFVWKYELVFRMGGWVYRMISPLIYGFVIAFILNLLVRKIEKCMTGRMWQNQTVKRCISIILSVVIAVGVITAVLAGLIPEIVNSAKVLQEKLPAVLQNVAAWMEENFHMSGNILDEMQKFKCSDHDFKGVCISFWIYGRRSIYGIGQLWNIQRKGKRKKMV